MYRTSYSKVNKSYNKYHRVKRITDLSTAALFGQPSSDAYFKEIFGISSQYIMDEQKIKDVIRYTNKDLRQTDEFSTQLGETVINFIEPRVMKKTKFGSFHSSKLIHFADYCSRWMKQSHKERLIDMFTTYYVNFYSQCKKELAELAIKFVDNNDRKRILNIVRAFKHSMHVEDFEILMAKIPDGQEDLEVREILHDMNKFECVRYKEEELKNNQDKRIKLIHAIVKRPTVAENLPFTFCPTLDDIKALPPVTRFDFLKILYAEKFTYPTTDKTLRLYDKIEDPRISMDQMKDLLFAICIDKNSQCSKWIEEYEDFLDRHPIHNAFSLTATRTISSEAVENFFHDIVKDIQSNK
jgi:hypothetical protein